MSPAHGNAWSTWNGLAKTKFRDHHRAMNKKEVALKRFNEQGGNCAQAVLAAFGPELGLEEKACLNLASCFGAGIGRLGVICGAATGACMALGLRHGPEMNEGPQGRDKLYGRVQEFSRRFRARFGSLDCATLTSCDLTSAEGRKSFADRGLHKGLCAGLVAGAVEILEEMPPK
jgi:C_GCAxxG_C_C family probable redox protein